VSDSPILQVPNGAGEVGDDTVIGIYADPDETDVDEQNEDNRGDAWEPLKPQPQPPKKTNKFSFERISLRQLLDTDYDQNYLIEDVLVAGQPLIIGAPKKALKTTLMIEMAICLASGLPFLGKWKVNQPIRVGIMSGESGEATIKETAARIVKAKGWDVPLDDLVRFCFRVPRFGEKSHMQALEEFIKEDGLKMLWVDPTYQAIPAVENASNLFAVGAILGKVTEIGQKTNCTMALLHHLRKNPAEPFIPPELEDLAWSGFAEWARQWILLGRRVKFDPESNGEHKLWMNIGGSAGHCSLWALDIEEGRKNDPGGRHWKYELNGASVARTAAVQDKRTKREAEKAIEDATTAAARQAKLIEVMRQHNQADTESVLRKRAGMSGEVFGPVIHALLKCDKVIKCAVEKHGKKYDGYQLRPTELFSGTTGTA